MKRFAKVLFVVAVVLILVFLYKRYFQVLPQNPSIVVNRNLSAQKADIEIIAAGDVMLGRTVMTTSLDQGDPTYPFKKVADTLKSADITFVNLENPIVENCPRKTDGLVFCAYPGMVEGLLYAGIDVVTLANNHSKNYGESGLAETKKILRASGIDYTYNSLAVKEIDGISFGFLGMEFVDKNITDEEIELVKALDKQVDVLILGIHWGSEYQAIAGSRQREIAKKLVDAGADIVIGSHPHWVQDIQYLENQKKEKVPVYFSLGNLVFDQMWSEQTKRGLVVRLTFDSKGNLKKEEKLPIYMKEWARPEFVK